MARACGIHVDQRRFRLIALDGSAKKHKVVAHAAGEIPLGEDPVEFVGRALRQAVKGKKVPAENVQLAVDSGLAAFRSLTLPFDDRSKIEEVLKFEIENQLPQWNIDDVVVDFLVVASKPGVESTLLVTALPKERLAAQLAACERAGLEPHDAELDGTALFNAASSAGILDEESAQLLVHVGDATTTLVLVDGGQIASMRAIRAGARPVPKEVLEPDEELDEEAAAAEVAAAARLQEQSTQRIKRELSRTIVGADTRFSIESIHVCGAPLPGLTDEETLSDRPVRRFADVPGDVPDPAGMVVAYGAALSQLGGGAVRSHLRRDELRYSGKFERLELPLAVFSLLLCTLLGVKFITLTHQLHWRDAWEADPDSPKKGDMQMWMHASNTWMLPDAERGIAGALADPPEAIQQYARRAERGEDVERTTYQQLQQIRRLLVIEIDKLQKDLGQVSEVPQPQSALRGATLVTGVIDSLGAEAGRFAVRQITADFAPGRGGQSDYVMVKLDMDFFGQDALVATGSYTNVVNAIQEQPWCRRIDKKSTNELEGGGGITFNGLTIEVDVSKAEEEQA